MLTGAVASALTAVRGRDGGVLHAADRTFQFAVAAAGLWAAYANLWRFRFPSVASDEPTYSIAAWRYIHGDNALPPLGGGTNTHNFEHPPLAKYLFGLAQLPVGHPSIPADRIVGGCCTLAVAVVVAVWIGRAAGRWTGLIAGLGLAVLPMRVSGLDFRFGRYGMLTPVAEVFMVASIAAAWVWFRRSGRTAWAWTLATGVFVGLASAAKENGFLGALGVVVLGVAWSARQPRELLIRVGQALAAIVASIVVFLACYLPLGHPIAALRFLLSFQWQQSHVGHLVPVAGRLTMHPPWWSLLWFAAHGLGYVMVNASLLSCLAAVVLRRDRLVAWCLAALAGPLIFHMFIAGVVLPYYWVLWMPAYVALTALGVQAITVAVSKRLDAKHLGPKRLGANRGGAAILATAFVAVFAVPSIGDSVHLATQPVTGAQRLPAVMAGAKLHGPILASGIPGWAFWDARLPAPMTYTVPADLARYDTIAVGPSICDHTIDATVLALVQTNLDSGALHEVYRDTKMTVYAARTELQPPTASQVRVQARSDPAC